jgi:Ca-activated chloride channel homolog
MRREGEDNLSLRRRRIVLHARYARSQNASRLARFFLVAIVLLAASSANHSQSRSVASAQSAQSTISVKTELVPLPVSVTDANGNVVSGLKAQDFRIYEDGHPQDISMFQDGDNPVSVGLIVDHSRSMGSKLSAVAAAVSAFARSSNPQDEMFVVDFNDDVTVELMNGKAFTNDPNELAKAVRAVAARGRTALYDAVTEGLVHLQLARWEKKALIIVSDGGDNASQQKFSQVLALARHSQVMIYSIGLVGADEEEDPKILRRLSKETGGEAYFPSSTESVTDVSMRIARDLRQQYTLGFVPTKSEKSDSFRKLDVKVTAPDRGKIHVRTRPGYFVGDEKQLSMQRGKNPS